MTEKTAVIVIRDRDNVGTATRDITCGEVIPVSVGSQRNELVARQDIRFLHKVAVRDIAQGERIYKYGAVIGEATKAIAAGEHVHVHNIRSLWGRISNESTSRHSSGTSCVHSVDQAGEFSSGPIVARMSKLLE